MIPYYMLKPEKFNADIRQYSSPQQNTIVGTYDSEPSTYFKKHDTQILNGYTKYDLRCEIKRNEKGRAYGNPEIFDSWISITEKNFYFSHKLDILIMSAPGDICNKFCKDFNKDEHFKFSRIEVDFDRIINNQYALGIKGIWLGKIPDIHINALLFYGNKIEDSTRYQQFLQEGAEVTNISIVYNYNGIQEKVMITKEGGIILYHPKDESDALLLIEDIYEKMIK